MSDPYGDAGNGVSDQHLWPIVPEPVQDGEMDEEELLPLSGGEGREDGVAQGLGEQAGAVVPKLNE